MLEPNFTQAQIDLLNTPLKQDEIEHKQGLSYLKGQLAIVKANRIFGIGNWSYKQIGPIELTESSTKNGKGNSIWLVSATVELVVRGCEPFVEQGDCESQGNGASSLSMARKGAVTDGVKRCLKNYGPAFGLDLYFDSPAQASSEPAAKPDNQPAPTPRQQPVTQATRPVVTQNGNISVNRTPAPSQPPVARPTSTPAPAKTVTASPIQAPTPITKNQSAGHTCPICDGPVVTFEGIGTKENPTEAYKGEKCTAKGCTYKKRIA